MTDPTSPKVAVLCALDRRGVATLTLNRPEKGNRYNQAMLDTLVAETARLGVDPTVRAIVLRAGGKHFCVGAEIGDEQPRAKDAPR
ncbi:MAG: enoyl-CoA hydratase-related protein, partial [Xanthobacteraceae bacterium]